MEHGNGTPDTPLHTLISLEDFKAILGIDDREDALGRFCLITATFTMPEHPGGDRNCYAYASSVATALRENPTLGGIDGKEVCPAETKRNRRRLGGYFDTTADCRRG
jgi:hypothetical protein